MYKNIFLLSFSVLMYASAIFVVVMSVFVSGCGDFLKIATKENGFFESISALLLLFMSIVGFRWIDKNCKKVSKWLVVGVFVFSFLCLLACLEEISYGQHFIHFKSSEFFQLNNYQKESNLHNLVPASLFSSVIYFCVYTFYIFIPLFLRLFEGILSKKLPFTKPLMPYLPPLHVSLMILFGSSFQAYFYDDFGAWSDTFTLVCGFVLFAFYMLNSRIGDKKLLIHFIFVLCSMMLFVYSYEIFEFYNCQYEIREMFVVLASLIYFEFLLGRFEVNFIKYVSNSN